MTAQILRDGRLEQTLFSRDFEASVIPRNLDPSIRSVGMDRLS